jgi:HK97 family phage major capsid protein
MKEINLVSILSSIINDKPLSDTEKRYLAIGEAEAKNNGLSFGSGIVLPSQRSIISAYGNVGETVAPILSPLRNTYNLPLAGARTYTDLIQDIKIPLLSKSNVYWITENGEAPEADTDITSIKLSPKRLSSYFDIGKSYFISDSESVEKQLVEDLEKTLYDKLEETVLSNTATEIAPQGIFAYSSITQTTINNYADIITLNSIVDNSNANGKRAYIISNELKNYLRLLSKGDNKGFVLENGKVDNETVFATSNCMAGAGLYGDFSNLLIGQWAGTSILIDNVTQASKGNIRLVICGFFDFALSHKEAFAIANIPETTKNKA